MNQVNDSARKRHARVLVADVHGEEFQEAPARLLAGGRAQIGFGVYRILKDKKLKQREIVDLLGIAQPDVSHLMNGHYNRFTTDKLLDFLKRLDQKVKIEIRPHRRGEPGSQFCNLGQSSRNHRCIAVFSLEYTFSRG